MLKGTFCAAMAALMLATGCVTSQKYDVLVTNDMPTPVTVWLTHLKPSDDPYWQPPEMVAVGTTGTQKLGGVALKPGETGRRVVVGKFSSDDVAILRIYNAIDLNEILSISHGSPDRLDVPLDPGKTDLDVVLENGQLATEPHRAKRDRPNPLPAPAANPQSMEPGRAPEMNPAAMPTPATTAPATAPAP